MLDAMFPGLGFLVCLGIWLSVPTPTKIIEGVWVAAGIIYEAIQTRGFRSKPAMIDFAEL
jgi:putrescine importer